MAKRSGKTVIFSTHVMEQAEQICDYIFLDQQGQEDHRRAADPRCAVGRDHGPSALDYDGDGSVLRNLTVEWRECNDAGKTAELIPRAPASTRRTF